MPTMTLTNQQTNRNDTFAVNPHAHVSEVRVGSSKHKVVIVDDFYADYQAVRHVADSVAYTDDPEIVFNFHGRRSWAPGPTGDVRTAVAGYYGVDHTEDSMIPVVISKSDGSCALSPSQRQPHVDNSLTALVYLNDADEVTGGTGLYRHRSTGVDWIPFRPTRAMAKLAQLLHYDVGEFNRPDGYGAFVRQVFMNPQFAAPEGQLICDGNEYWELLDVIEMRPNRLVIYDGRIPHSLYHGVGDFDGVERVYQLISLPVPDGRRRADHP